MIWGGGCVSVSLSSMTAVLWFLRLSGDAQPVAIATTARSVAAIARLLDFRGPGMNILPTRQRHRVVGLYARSAYHIPKRGLQRGRRDGSGSVAYRSPQKWVRKKGINIALTKSMKNAQTSGTMMKARCEGPKRFVTADMLAIAVGVEPREMPPKPEQTTAAS